VPHDLAESHPRTQLARERWTDLSGPWGFAYDDADVGLRQGWPERSDVFDRTITVPFPPESRASGIGDPSPHPVVWYRREFQAPPREPGERLLLHFGAVDYRAQVWVNGRLVAQHEGGHTPFSADIADALDTGAPSDDQVVVVRAEDQPTDLAQPRGKQYWEEGTRRIWYHRTSGIWQPVWLEPVAAAHVAELRWTPDLDRGLLGLQATLSRPPDRPLRLRMRLALRGATLADDTYAVERAEVRRDVALEPASLAMGRDRLLWSPDHPNLIDAELALLDGDRVVDEVWSYAGLRSAAVADGRFLLNGQPYYPRLVLEQGYWPESHLAAPSAVALRREVELIKALGFDGARVHQKVEDPRFLYWCDRLGLLVWGEMANAFVFSPTAVERLTREWLEVLRRDYSHPCVVTWVPLNESWGVPGLGGDPAQRDYVRALYHLTRALDPTRPVIGNDGWEHVASDIWGIHDYALDGATLRERYGTPEAVERTIREVRPHHRPIHGRAGQPVMLTECGGITDAPRPGTPWYGYGSVRDAEALLAKYEEMVGAILDCPTIVGFCYTQLTDTEQERNGLLTADRAPKVDPDAIRAITRRPARAMPSEALEAARAAAEISTFQGAGE
jgi:beta-galactosidase/beta-glucuronidase